MKVVHISADPQPEYEGGGDGGEWVWQEFGGQAPRSQARWVDWSGDMVCARGSLL